MLLAKVTEMAIAVLTPPLLRLNVLLVQAVRYVVVSSRHRQQVSERAGERARERDRWRT